MNVTLADIYLLKVNAVYFTLANIYLFKDNNTNTTAICDIC